MWGGERTLGFPTCGLSATLPSLASQLLVPFRRSPHVLYYLICLRMHSRATDYKGTSRLRLKNKHLSHLGDFRMAHLIVRPVDARPQGLRYLCGKKWISNLQIACFREVHGRQQPDPYLQDRLFFLALSKPTITTSISTASKPAVRSGLCTKA